MARLRYKYKVFFKPSARPAFLVVLLIVCAVSVVGLNHLVRANSGSVSSEVVLADSDPNFHVKTIATQFFEDNDATELIPIIDCESNFRQFTDDGTPLQNHEGSSATGVAQILTSKHPDPKVIKRYNQRYDMDMTVDDFDLMTLEGNLGYALVLFKVRGVRDWECARKVF